MRRCFTDPHYWKNPALRRSREKPSWADMVVHGPEAKKKELEDKKPPDEGEPEWWQKDWNSTGKAWDEWWNEKEREWKEWQEGISEETGDDEKNKEKPQEKRLARKNRTGSQKERSKRRWLEEKSKGCTEEQKALLKLGALGQARASRMLSRQQDREQQMTAAKAAKAAAAHAAEAAEAAQAAQASSWAYQQQAFQYQQEMAYQSYWNQAYYQQQHWEWKQNWDQSVGSGHFSFICLQCVCHGLPWCCFMFCLLPCVA